MARQSAGRRRAEETDEVETDEVETEDEDASRSEVTNELWESVHIDIVEIALPKGVGYTLRAYRAESDVAIPTDISEREADPFPDRHRPAHQYVVDEKAILDEDEEEDADEFDEDTDTDRPNRAARRRQARHAAGADDDDEDLDEAEDDLEDDDEDEAEDDEDDEDEDEAEDDEDDLEDDEDEAEADEDDEAEDDEDDEDEPDDEDDDAVDDDAEKNKAAGDAAEPEIEEPEVPIFLGSHGKVYLFQSPEGLVEYLRSGADHDMSQLASWPDLMERITPEDVVPLPDDRYELDLVVANLRGGHQAWDPDLLIRAGEVARDLGYALQLEPVQNALAPGSPLDDLDETMRASAAGGIGGFMARRRLKKIGAEAAPLGWRTIIGKISAAVDWRD